MGRARRCCSLGQFSHVMLRGNAGQNIFFSDSDRYAMSFLLQEGVERFGHKIHGFCFMSNHIHLLVEIDQIPLSKIMHNLAFRYSRKINLKFRKNGHLFQDRYKALPIKNERYFLRVLRYIHRNPVRANMVNSPEKYIWSGHNSYINQNKINWLTVLFGLSKFGTTNDEALTNYISYAMLEETTEEIQELRSSFKEGQVFKPDNILFSVENRSLLKKNEHPTAEMILAATCELLGFSRAMIISKSQLEKVSYARAIISMVARTKSNISLGELAELLKRDQSSISSLISRFKAKHIQHTDTQILMEKIFQRGALIKLQSEK